VKLSALKGGVKGHVPVNIDPVRNSLGELNPAKIILKSNTPCRALHRMVYRAEQQDIISNGVKEDGL
jgi:hypothetical protein